VSGLVSLPALTKGALFRTPADVKPRLGPSRAEVLLSILLAKEHNDRGRAIDNARAVPNLVVCGEQLRQ